MDQTFGCVHLVIQEQDAEVLTFQIGFYRRKRGAKDVRGTLRIHQRLLNPVYHPGIPLQ